MLWIGYVRYNQKILRGAYVRDYIFDVVFEVARKTKVLEVM